MDYLSFEVLGKTATMLTPQEVLMHAQAVLLPGRKPPAMEGSYECYPCRVIRIGEIGSFEALNGSL